MAEVAGGKEGTRSTLKSLRDSPWVWRSHVESLTTFNHTSNKGFFVRFLLDAAVVCTLEHLHAVKNLTEVESMISLTECYIENNSWYNFFLNQMRRRELGALGRVSTRQLTTCVELLHVVELDGQSI